MESDNDIIGAVVIATEFNKDSNWVMVEKDGKKYAIVTSEWLTIDEFHDVNSFCDKTGLQIDNYNG